MNPSQSSSVQVSIQAAPKRFNNSVRLVETGVAAVPFDVPRIPARRSRITQRLVSAINRANRRRHLATHPLECVGLGENLGSSLHGVVKRQVFKGVQGIVVDEDCDRASARGMFQAFRKPRPSHDCAGIRSATKCSRLRRKLATIVCENGQQEGL